MKKLLLFLAACFMFVACSDEKAAENAAIDCLEKMYVYCIDGDLDNLIKVYDETKAEVADMDEDEGKAFVRAWEDWCLNNPEKTAALDDFIIYHGLEGYMRLN